MAVKRSFTWMSFKRRILMLKLWHFWMFECLTWMEKRRRDKSDPERLGSHPFWSVALPTCSRSWRARRTICSTC
eukprot:symbB.v1.2.021200.t1/scaffold1820.1/size101099/2